MLEQEKQVSTPCPLPPPLLTPVPQNAMLRKHISLLEGGDASSASVVGSHASGGGGSTVDDVRSSPTCS